MTTATTISIAVTANVLRMPMATTSGRAVVISTVAAASAPPPWKAELATRSRS